MHKIPVASHSFLSVYERCPKQAFHKYVVRDEPYVETEAIKWGNEVHKALELAINEAKPLPEGMAKLSADLNSGDPAKIHSALTTLNSFGEFKFGESNNPSANFKAVTDKLNPDQMGSIYFNYLF